MTDMEFLDRAEQLLQAVERRCDELSDQPETDLDSQRAGGMVTITFADRSQIVINQQKPLHEIWLATRLGGYHYRWDGDLWKDTKGAGNFFEQLSRDASAHAGSTVAFSLV